MRFMSIGDQPFNLLNTLPPATLKLFTFSSARRQILKSVSNFTYLVKKRMHLNARMQLKVVK